MKITIEDDKDGTDFNFRNTQMYGYCSTSRKILEEDNARLRNHLQDLTRMVSTERNALNALLDYLGLRIDARFDEMIDGAPSFIVGTKVTEEPEEVPPPDHVEPEYTIPEPFDETEY